MKFTPTAVIETPRKRKVSLPFIRNTHEQEMDKAYPVRRLSDNGMVLTTVKNNMGFSYKEFSYYLAVSPYDLTNLTQEELDEIQANYSSLHKIYREPMKEVFLAFPENNTAQQNFIQQLMEKESNSQKLALQQKELNKLLFLEESHITYTSFVQIFGRNAATLEENYKEFVRSANKIFATVDILDKENVKLLLSLYNNGSQAVKRKAPRIGSLNPKMDLAMCSPQGGMTFDPPTYFVQGARYRSVVTIESKPSLMPTWWLSNITARAGADVVTVDYNYDPHYHPLKSIDSTIISYSKLRNNASNPTDIQKYQNEIGYLLGLSNDINDKGEIMKNVRIHVHLSSYSDEERGKKIKKLMDELAGKSFASTIIVNNTKVDYQSFFISYKAQEFLDENVEIGKLRLPTRAIAEGFNHNNISLSDEMGFYIGQSVTGGSLYFNNFTKTGRRLSYSMIISGVQGGGKTALLKKLMLDHYLAGGRIFGYDVNGEFHDLIESLHGVLLSLDGREGIINFLQVFPFVTEEAEDSMEVDVSGCFDSHLDSLVDRLQAINSFDKDVASDIRGILLNFYIAFGIWSNPEVPDITALKNTEYPTFEDLSVYVNRQYESLKDKMDPDIKTAYERLIKITRTIESQYQSLLIGHTTLDKNINNDVVFFDISRLKNGQAGVYDAVFQASLSLVLGLSNKYGRAEKRAYDRGEKPWASLSRTMIAIAECHNILNPEKYYNVSAIDILSREARKFFISYILDTQLIESMLPVEVSHNLSDTASFAMAKLANIVSLTQYKIFVKQAPTSIKSLEKYFSEELKPKDYGEMLKYDISDRGSRMKLIISGDKVIDFYCRLTKEELSIFRGGA